MADRKVFQTTVDGQTFAFFAADVYDGSGSTIGEAVGIAARSSSSGFVFPAGSLVTAGILDRLSIQYRQGTGPRKSASIYCRSDLTRKAVGDLPGKTYRSATVTSARKSRKTNIS